MRDGVRKTGIWGVFFWPLNETSRNAWGEISNVKLGSRG